jgi:AcrR family transcriptional regulator
MRPRVVKEHDVRRGEILACARALFDSAGYEDTTVNAIIERAGIAKGTFYHYFAGKEDLLDALVDEIVERLLDAISPIVARGDTATEKLRRVHDVAAGIKSTHAATLLRYLRVFYRPDNLVARHRMTERMLARAQPLYAQIIRQGVAERVFDTKYPEEAAEIFLRMWSGLGERFARLLMEAESSPDRLSEAERVFAVYEEAAERLLGAPAGSLHLADPTRRVLEAFRLTLERRPDAVAAAAAGAAGA